MEDRFILFGEWVYARDSIHYCKLTHYFFEFDINDKQTESFADYIAHIEIVNLEPPPESVLRQNKARSSAVPEQLIRKLADGIAYIHDQGVVHRDLKPENILITEGDQPVILDFGLALTKGARRVTYANLTPTAGTPDYMAPEQIEGQRGDERTDIYAVGTMLYELLSGRLPYSGDNYQVIMTQHLQGAIPRLDKEQPGITPQLAAVVARCLQRDPNARYATMHGLSHDLDHLDAVDVSVLEVGTGAATAVPFWRLPTFRTIVVSVIVLLGIIIFALAVQGFAPK